MKEKCPPFPVFYYFFLHGPPLCFFKYAVDKPTTVQQGGTHLLFSGEGGERKQHRGRADNQKVGGRRAREKVDEV
jgi:hypothetical protein